MDARQRRIQADIERVKCLCWQSGRIDMLAWSDTTSLMLIQYRCKGLTWLPEHPVPSVICLHQMEINLHLDYPRLPPRLHWLTEIFHPNILSQKKNGGVCIGMWTPAETLDQLILRVGEMVQYKSFNTSDALDLDAAKWADKNRHRMPVDRSGLLKSPTGVSIS